MFGIEVLMMVLSAVSGAPEQIVLKDVQHVKVYGEQGRFGGWPANHGMWIWDNEILVGYSRAWYKDMGERHHVDREKPEEHWLARSIDGGETWTQEHPAEKGQLIPEGESLHGTETPGLAIKPATDCPGGINFLHPDFAMTMRMNSTGSGQSRFYYSYDKGKDWEGPFRFPNFESSGNAARTDYIVEDEDSCTFFSTAAKSDGKEGRVFCYRTDDGGKSFQFLSYLGPEMASGSFGIMPSSVRLSDNELICATRIHDGDRKYIGLFRSVDNGLTWTAESDPVDNVGKGNPPAMIQLKDGRICLTYGYRAKPYSMCAKLSDDGGKTWGPELVLRNDGNTTDMGYPRTVQRPDGKVVTVYYFADGKEGPERFIGATIWTPPAQ
jgi:Neuraminidase (sialidase)